MERLKSRKLWVTIVSAVIMVANQGLGLKLPEDSILSFAGVVMSYIFGQSIVDAKQLSNLPLAPAHAEPLKVFNDQSKASDVIKDDKKAEIAPAPAPDLSVVAPVLPVAPTQPDPNQEKLNKITELEQQLNQLRAEVNHPASSNVVITQ